MSSLIKQMESPQGGRSGRVAFLYRPETINPAVVYVYLDWDQWKISRLRHIGVIDQVPFFIRPMTDAEREYCESRRFLTFHAFRNWEDLISREIRMSAAADDVALMYHYKKNFKLDSNGKEQQKEGYTEPAYGAR